MGSWEKLGRTIGLLVLVATLSAATAGTVLVSPADPPGPPGPPEATPSLAAAPPPSASPPPAASPLPAILTHIVAAGETVIAVAERYGISPATVTSSSGVRNPDRIYPGQTLTFPSVDGLLYRVRAGDNLSGVSGLHQVTAEAVIAANRIADPNNLQVGQMLIIPGGKVRTAVAAAAGTSPSKTSAPAASSGLLAWPIQGSLSSPFGARWGRTHSGIDIAAPYGATIRAAAVGKVIFVGWYGLYGRCAIIDHGGGLTTLYGHASAILAHIGDRVQAGDPIAEVGSSGNSTGPHVHFEVRVSGQPRNPLNYLGG